MKVRLIKKNTWWGRSGFLEEPVYYFQIKVLFWWETVCWISESNLQKGKYESIMEWFENRVQYLKNYLDKQNNRTKEVGLFGTKEVLIEREI